MSKTETPVSQLKINRLTKTQFDSASELSDTELYAVDPQFAGGKLLETDSDGEIVESTLDPTNIQEKTTVQALDATDSITLADNTIYNGSTQTSLTIALPATDSVDFICEIDFSSGGTATTLSYPNTIKWIGDDISSNVFVPVTNKRYTIIVAYDGVNYRATVKGVA